MRRLFVRTATPAHIAARVAAARRLARSLETVIAFALAVFGLLAGPPALASVPVVGPVFWGRRRLRP